MALFQACVDAMAKYMEKDAQYELEKQRLAELEELQRHLQILLEKERQARETETSARLLQEKLVSNRAWMELHLISLLYFQSTAMLS
jgi:hypothetical protein